MILLLEDFDWQTLLLGKNEWGFLLEAALRSAIMFIIILLSLRFLGKRGITQLSVFELGVIIGLGSAAGDPMFYKEVGLLPGVVVFIIVVSLYKFVTYLVNRSPQFETFVEGKPAAILDEGRILLPDFKEEPIAMDEFLAELRLKSVTHLGQVQHAIIETNGEISIFFYPDEEVKYGLPILPKFLQNKSKTITKEAVYACAYCGNIEKLSPMHSHTCPICQEKEWVKAMNTKRIS